MNNQDKEIAKKYLLPERPFLHGMASAFDLFGVLSQGKNEQLLANMEEEFQRTDRDILRSAWSDVGENLYWAMKRVEAASGGSSRK